MEFNIDFDVISLIFLLIVVFKFFSQKQFPLLSNRVFGGLLLIAMANLVLDIAGTLTLLNIDDRTLWIPYVINAAYYIVELLLPAALVSYLTALAANRRTIPKHVFLLLALPALACVLVFLAALPMGLVFRISAAEGYTYGPLAPITYVCVGIYFPITIAAILTRKSLFTANEKQSIWALLALILAAVLIQYLHPRLLLTGTALAMGSVIIYFTLQDPQKMLDEDTGLFNSGALLQFLHAKYSTKKGFYIVTAELHGLHNYYMLYGREAGNRVLREVCTYMQTVPDSWSFRAADAQFVTVLQSESDMDRFVTALEKKKETPVSVGSIHVKPQITALCIRNAEQLEDAETALQVIESALSEKNLTAMQNKTVFLDRQQLRALARDADIENQIRECIPTGQYFQVYYQPIYCLEKQAFCSAEALLRFRSPELGRLTPDEFIPIVELNGLSMELDEMVVEKTFAQIEEGVFRALNIDSVHINLSAASFANEQTTNRILNLAKRYDIDPGFVVFEITETAATLSDDTLAACVERLRANGFGLALDDFGTGYSNITRVLRLPFSYVKLDQSLIRESAMLMEDLVRIFRNFPMKVIAEGIETEEQLEIAKTAGVSAIQGYYYARPMPADDLTELLESSQS